MLRPSLDRSVQVLRVISVTLVASALPFFMYACSSTTPTTEDGGLIIEGCEGGDCLSDCVSACQKIESDRCLPLYTDCDKTCKSTSPNARKDFAACTAGSSAVDCAETECYYGIPGAPRISPARIYDVCIIGCQKMSQSEGLACLSDEQTLKCQQTCKNGTIDAINTFNKCMSTWSDRCIVGKPCFEAFTK